MFFHVLFTVLCFVKDLRLWSFFVTYLTPIFALTWRSLCAHLGQKVDKIDMFTALASKLDFKTFVNDSNTTCRVNAAKTIAQSMQFYRPCQRLETAFRLRLCEQIKGGAIQKTNRQRSNSIYEPTRSRSLFCWTSRDTWFETCWFSTICMKILLGKPDCEKRQICDRFATDLN